jgi:hypothetical protein
LENLYESESNQFCEFDLYFIIKPGSNVGVDCDKLIKHFSKFINTDTLNHIAPRVYKNTGFICYKVILVFYANSDINNLKQIAKNIKNEMFTNIKYINKTVDLD